MARQRSYALLLRVWDVSAQRAEKMAEKSEPKWPIICLLQLFMVVRKAKAIQVIL